MPTRDPTVLIVGQSPDPHIDRVRELLVGRGASVHVFDRHHPAHRLTLDTSDGVRGSVSTTDGDLSLDRLHSVWWRLKPVMPADFEAGVGSVAAAFAVREWRAVLRCLPVATGRARWVNPIEAHYRTARKLEQLRLAGEVGLPVPDTLITNSADAVLALFDRVDRVIYKTLSSFIFPPDGIIFTNEITREQVLESRERIAAAPGIFQELMPKRHELRVTVVGEEMFVAQIDSQSASDTRLDWRRNQGRAMYSCGALSAETSASLWSFHQRAGLVFGAYDFIVDWEGREVFLECNPGGQWLWLENAVSLPISDCLAELLLSKPED